MHGVFGTQTTVQRERDSLMVAQISRKLLKQMFNTLSEPLLIIKEHFIRTLKLTTANIYVNLANCLLILFQH